MLLKQEQPELLKLGLNPCFKSLHAKFLALQWL